MLHFHKAFFMNTLQIPRSPAFKDKHDPIYAVLDRIDNWFVFGHLSFLDDLQHSEARRIKSFHLIIRDLARRSLGRRDLDSIGWFLKQEGWDGGKRYHFHFALTNDNLTRTTPEAVCRFLGKQWQKVTGASASDIRPWDRAHGLNGIWYLTELEDKPPRLSTYFEGERCHYKISKLLHKRMLDAAPRHAEEGL
jgi:hypothetical protein